MEAALFAVDNDVGWGNSFHANRFLIIFSSSHALPRLQKSSMPRGVYERTDAIREGNRIGALNRVYPLGLKERLAELARTRVRTPEESAKKSVSAKRAGAGFKKGHATSVNTRAKISATKKARMTPEIVERLREQGIRGRLAQTGRKETKIETMLYAFLREENIEFEAQKVIGHFIVDAFIPSKKLVIEADGDYWHSLPRAVVTDKLRDARLTSSGYSIIRFSERRDMHSGVFKETLRRILL